MSWKFHNPVAVTFGEAALERLPSELAARTAVLVAFPEAASLGYVERVQRLIGPALAGVVDDIEPNPDVLRLERLHARFWNEFARCDVILALGGGSTLDTAKVLAVRPASGAFRELLHLLEGGVDDVLGQRALAPRQHLVHELGHQDGAVDGVGRELAAGGGSVPGHA